MAQNATSTKASRRCSSGDLRKGTSEAKKIAGGNMGRHPRKKKE